MLNLRALYGSRMPQALHPRSDPQIASYWEHDTASSRELARAMEEAEAADAADSSTDGSTGASDGGDVAAALKKPTAALFEDANPVAARARGRPTLSARLADLLAPPTADLPALADGTAPGSPPFSQLSPTGLISIAAADIDEAAESTSPRPGAPRDLDWEFIAALRRRATGEDAEYRPSTSSTRRADEVVSQLLGQTPAGVDGETQSQLRFLSLLRRINEIRSQQHMDHEEWEGLPYPQILALPTFRYEKRASTESRGTESEGGEPALNNTLCAVCYTEYETDEELRTLPCLHYYHRECIDQWLLHHRLCPICKHVVAVY